MNRRKNRRKFQNLSVNMLHRDHVTPHQYRGGVYLLLIQFSDDYPVQPPTVRFHTPIRHVNVNSYGRICHGILSRDWSASMSIRSVLDCIFGLLLAPDTQDALDSVDPLPDPNYQSKQN